jgi:DNA-binding response OmpR family regulator
MPLISLQTEIPEIPGDKAALTPVQSCAKPARRILVVNDELDTRQFYCEALAQTGYQVDAAEDGDAGWKMLLAASHDSNGYDLVITDNNMPKMSGVEMIRKLRAAGMTLFVIMATSAVPPDLEKLNIAAILEKPFNTQQLVQTVKDALTRPLQSLV